MVSTRFDNLWPWLHMEPEEDPPGFRVGSDAADPILGNTSFGLSNWQPPKSLQRPPWLTTEPQDDPLGFRGGAGIADSTPATTSFGLSNWRPPDSVRQPAEDNADGSLGLFSWRPPHSLDQPSSIGFRMKADGSIDEARTGNANPFDAGVPTFGVDPLQDMEQRLKSQPWWSEASRQAGGYDDALRPRWPWLRAESGHEWPAPNVEADASTQETGTPTFNPLSFAAPPSVQQPAVEDADSDMFVPLSDKTTSLGDLRPAAAGAMATTANAATAGGAPGSQIVAEALSRAAGFAGRVAPAATGAGSAAVGALPLLFIPTNTQSETIDLEDGVRARVSPGQRTVEIERRVGSGLFGTDFGARWERLPVDAEVRVGKDGAATLVIDQGQLRQALSPTEDRDAVTSEMARPPDKDKGDFGPTPGIGHNSGDKPDPNSGEAAEPKNDKAPDPKSDKAPDPKNDKTPDPNDGGKPSIWDHVLASTYKILRSGRQEKSVDEERIDTCRKVMKGIGQPAPDGQYRGPDGRDTAAGVRLGPDMRDPASGLDHYPEQQHLRDGVRGEQELANRIRQLNPKEKIIHFGPAAGAQGPDVMSISEKGEVAFWDSKLRNREQSIPPSRRANPTEESLYNLKDTEKHIMKVVADGTLSKEVAAKALANLITGNFLLCTVGMGQAHQGVVEIVKDGQRTGPL
jgi:hypothetical protein